MLVSESRVLGSREVRLRASLAVVNRDDEGERARELRGFVEEHANIVRIGTNVGGDLLQLILCSERGERVDERERRGRTVVAERGILFI